MERSTFARRHPPKLRKSDYFKQYGDASRLYALLSRGMFHPTRKNQDVLTVGKTQDYEGLGRRRCIPQPPALFPQPPISSNNGVSENGRERPRSLYLPCTATNHHEPHTAQSPHSLTPRTCRNRMTSRVGFLVL